ncbi:hypothetical protein ACJMK2_023915 [Sinanodonta woodiana]|uniref:Oxidoreductase NAD-binding domain-containing protein 1 n=1 Tax=Sinanodonta woodiana TaxID=1069815 RepID=A0ABD3T6P5_SINWO
MHCLCFIRQHLPSELRSCLFTDLKRHFLNVMAVRGDHMDRTACNTREEVVSIATVIDVREETRTVKGLSLKIHDKRLKFKAGQWVDMFIPDVPKVGGFSICSSPGKLEREGILDLAVKYSTHPPAHWVHTQCQVGNTVSLRVGGDFYWIPNPSIESEDLLLIAGGVGINPLYSILNNVVDLASSSQTSGKVFLLYSARQVQELLFKMKLLEIMRTYSHIRCQFHVTREQRTDSGFQYRRIGCEDISQALLWLNKKKVKAFLCGPSSMLEDMERHIHSLGIANSAVMYEKWW